MESGKKGSRKSSWHVEGWATIYIQFRARYASPLKSEGGNGNRMTCSNKQTKTPFLTAFSFYICIQGLNFTVGQIKIWNVLTSHWIKSNWNGSELLFPSSSVELKQNYFFSELWPVSLSGFVLFLLLILRRGNTKRTQPERLETHLVT